MEILHREDAPGQQICTHLHTHPRFLRKADGAKRSNGSSPVGSEFCANIGDSSAIVEGITHQTSAFLDSSTSLSSLTTCATRLPQASRAARFSFR